MPRIAVVTRKGGVGKSEVTVALAAAFARRHERTLVVDLDPQANASRRLAAAWDQESGQPTVSEAIKADTIGVGEDVVVPCGWTDSAGERSKEAEYIDVLPSRLDLMNRETETGQVGAIRRLKKALDGWSDDYDWQLYDNRPDLGHLVQMSMAAADYVLVPCALEFDAIDGAMEVQRFIDEHAEDIFNPTLQLLAVLPTRYDGRKAEQQFQYEGLRNHFRDLVLKFGGMATLSKGDEFFVPPYIPERTRFAEADSAAASLTAWNDRVGRETTEIYDRLAEAIVARVKQLEEVAA
ncbi:ParA family protein [Planctomonas sp. JC2975]|uniref:AAA family ATPase n=1 Tax=Planctomonas sp. JC2975 TaxID=2729626 RepID=UPI001472B0B3|nr:ParA family protein [Planctomonas sp. JC2975]